MSLTLRGIKGSALTHAELDNNFLWLGNRGTSNLTLNGDVLTITRGDDSYYTISLSGVGTTVTGLSYTGNTLTLFQSDGSSESVVISADSFVTGFTYNNANRLTISQNQGKQDINVFINQMSGLTINGTLNTDQIVLSGTNLTDILGNTVKKYSQTLTSPTAGRYTITHNLGTTDISVSLWLAFSNELTNAKVLNRLPNSVDVEFSVAPGEDVLVLIMGTTVNSSGVAYIYSAVTVGPNQIAYGDATGLITSNSSFVRNPISGNIGVGVTSPSAKLHINNTGTDNTVLFEDNTNPDSTPFVIDNSGNVGVGTLTASTKLDVRGTFNLQPSSNTYLRYDSYMLDAQVGSSNIGLTLNVDNFGGSQLRGLSASLVTPTSSFGIGNNTWFRENDKIIFSSTDNYVRGWWDIQNSRLKIGGGGYVPIYSSTTETFEVVGTSKITGNVGIGISGSTDVDTRLKIVGSDSSSSNYGLKVQNSVGTNTLQVRNDGLLQINTPTLSYGNLITVKAKDALNDSLVYRDSTDSYDIFKIKGDGYTTARALNIDAPLYPLINFINVYSTWTIERGGYDLSINEGITERLFMASGGNVGFSLGTTPTARLHVKGVDESSSNYGLKVQNSGGTNTLQVRNDGLITVNDVTNGSDSSNSVRFYQTIPATGTYNYGFLSVGAPTYANYAAVGNTSRTHFYSSESPKTAYEADMAATVSSPYRAGFGASVIGINTGGTNVALYSDVRNGVSNYTIYSVNGDSFFNKTSMTLNGKTTGSDSVFSVNNSGGTNNFVVRNDGNIGIGTSTPSETLEVNGKTKITGTLNIGTIGSGSPLINLGLDSLGNVVTGTTGGGGGTFTGGTISGPTNFTNGLTANTLTVGTFSVGRKFSSSESFTGSVVKTITHNLNTQDLIVQLWDSSNNLLNGATIVANNVNSVDITVSSTATYKVVIIG